MRQDSPHPVALQEKLVRLGWTDWEPTPGVTDEGAMLYITIGGRSTSVMTTDEALTLSDTELQKRIESAIGMSYEDACKVPRAPAVGCMNQREQIEAQIRDLQQKALQQPLTGDGAGIVGLAATLLAAQLQVLLLQNDLKTAKEVPDAHTS